MSYGMFGEEDTPPQVKKEIECPNCEEQCEIHYASFQHPQVCPFCGEPLE